MNDQLLKLGMQFLTFEAEKLSVASRILNIGPLYIKSTISSQMSPQKVSCRRLTKLR